MIGWHYTTKWDGCLVPGPINPMELESFRKVTPDLCDNAIWVWREKPDLNDAWIISTYLAIVHKCSRIILLQVEYSEDEAASIVYNPLKDSVNYRCSFGIGEAVTKNMKCELLIKPTRRVLVLGSFDLQTSVRTPCTFLC